MSTEPPESSSDRAGERGSVMPMATILIVFLMMGGWALLSASEQWAARRDVHAAAASAARAGAQGDVATLRGGVVIDPAAASGRARAILDAAGYRGSVVIDDETVTVTATTAVNYAFPAPGFPGSVSGSASAVATRGVISEGR